MNQFISLADAEAAKKYPSAKPIDTTDEAKLAQLLKSHKISKDEYQKILEIKKSQPTLSELGVFSAMWSEHCSYKSSRVHLKRFPTTGPNVVVGPGENAGVVRLEGKMCVAFKMESHNHPSYIEPYQGAATGVGGILRDVFCMGARPFANLNCLRFGEQSFTRTNFLVPRVVKGIGDYGNCVGIPTVGGSISYDKSYNGNCLVNAMTAGLIRDDKIFKGFATGIGNLVVYVGSATGRDGIHGATMASDSFAAKADNSKTTIQVGDPFAEKLLLETTLEVLEKDLVVGIQDMGAAGLTSSSFEMAGRAGNGVYINLDRVPVRAKEMTAYEIMLSESQERMLMVVEPKKWDELKTVLSKWQLAFDIIGVVTDTGRMQISAKNILEIDLPVSPLTDEAPVYKRPIADKVEKQTGSALLESLSKNLNTDTAFAQAMFAKAVQDTGSKQKIYEQFDRHIGTKTVLSSEQSGAAVMWIRSEETKKVPYLGVTLSAGCNERKVKNHPFNGAANAVLACARKIAAVGGSPLAITDCLNFGSAEDPKVMREFSDSVDGISSACNHLNVPVVSGNVSLYNSTDGISIHPTPMIGMVGRTEDIRLATPALMDESAELKIYILEKANTNTPQFAASLVAKLNDISPEEGSIPNIDWHTEKQLMVALDQLRQNNLLAAVRDVGEGGAGVAATKMLLGADMKNYNVKINAKSAEEFFGEDKAQYLVQLKNHSFAEAMTIVNNLGLAMKEFLVVQSEKTDGNVESYFGACSFAKLKAAFNAAQPIARS